MFRLYTTILFLLLSAPSFSHGGHDHTSPMAGVIHLLWVAPLVIGVAFIAHQVAKRYNFFIKKK